MKGEDIINLAKTIREKYKTNDPDYIIDKFENFKLGETNINPKVFKAQAIKYNDYISIILNKNYTGISRKFLLAHELGHALLHKDFINYMDGGYQNLNVVNKEYEANLFAVALLIDESTLNVEFEKLSPYELSCIMDMNIQIKDCC